MQWWRYAWPGFLATLTAVGLARFAYSALMPFLVAFGTFSVAGAAYLGAANLIGYFFGAAGAARLAQAIGMTRALRMALLLTALGLAACVLPWGFWWYVVWRAVVGLTAGVLMVLAPSFLYAGSPPVGRGRIGGVVFSGIGVGIVLSGLLVAPLARLGPSWVWVGLATLAAAATAVTWRRWRGGGTVILPARRHGVRFGAAAWLAILAFASDGIGYTAHGLFWVDFIARGLDRGPQIGALAWTLFGLGATLGPMLAGSMGDTFGIGRSFLLGLLIKSFGVLLPVLSTTLPMLAVSSLVVGALTPAFPALTSARLAELVPPADLTRAWGFATLTFAFVQGAAGFAMSFAFARLGSYIPLFVAGSIALLCGACAALASTLLAPPRAHSMTK